MMKKFWVVYAVKNPGTFKHYDTRQDAVDEARRQQAADQNNQFVVLEAILNTVRPVPLIEMKELV